MVRSDKVTWQAWGGCLALVLCVGLVGRGLAGEPAGKASPKKLRVVVFGAHCDDPESGAGGLILLLTRAGHEVYCAYATCFRGQRAFFGRPEAEVRREESEEACRRLGAKPKFFPYAHEKLAVDEATVKAVGQWLAEIKPDIVEIWKCHDAMHRRRGAECGVQFAEAYWLVEAKPQAALLPVALLPKKR